MNIGSRKLGGTNQSVKFDNYQYNTANNGSIDRFEHRYEYINREIREGGKRSIS